MCIRDRGIAEEVGKSIRLSELFGFPAIKHLNQYYQNKKKENFEEIKLINNINKSDGSSFCPIMLGVNFIDQVKNIETLKKCSVENLAYPLLLLSFLSRASIVFSKVGSSLFEIISSISLKASEQAIASAGSKCSSLMISKGAILCGVSQFPNNGFGVLSVFSISTYPASSSFVKLY